MRLINADELKNELRSLGWFEDDNESFTSCLEDVIDDAPTIDAQPVVHGKWENVNPVEVPLYRCSVCGNTPTVIKTNFCPDCGARMVVEDEQT